MSRMEVAKLCAISKSAISMYEIGKRIPKDDIKIRLAKCYNTTVEKIFYL
jgi:putative transcriptional regulator